MIQLIQHDLPDPVQAEGASSRRDKLADAVAVMIQAAGEMPVGPAEILPPARVRPVASPVVSIKLITERAGVPSPVAQAIHDQRYDAHSHWGLNE